MLPPRTVVPLGVGFLFIKFSTDLGWLIFIHWVYVILHSAANPYSCSRILIIDYQPRLLLASLLLHDLLHPLLLLL